LSRSIVFVSPLILCASLAAQVTTAQLEIGNADSVSCQNSSGFPALTGGVRASADLDFRYDASNGELTLTVDNTSPIVAGEANALIVDLWLNLPDDAVTGASLRSQSGAGGATPTWQLSFGTDAFGAACMGAFDLHLDNGGGVANGIANPNAPILGGPPGSQVLGPVTFVIDLQGPGLATMTADSIAFGLSQNAPARQANAAAKFQAAGQNGEESGFLGAGQECTCASWSPGPARIGGTLKYCRVGTPTCHDCLWISDTVGPTVFGPPINLTAPIGFPLLATLDFGTFSGRPDCLEIPIPDDPMLIGFKLHFAIVTVPQPPFTLDDVSFCGALSVEIQG